MPSTPYALLQIQGHQVRVSPGSLITVDRIDGGSAAVGSSLSFSDVLLAADDAGEVRVGTPFLKGCKVVTEVVEHPRGDKIRVFKMKPKKRYRRTRGHRADLTTLRVTALEF